MPPQHHHCTMNSKYLTLLLCPLLCQAQAELSPPSLVINLRDTAISEALHGDDWDELRKLIPELRKGANPQINAGSESRTLGEQLIIMRSWNCLRGMMRNGLKPTAAMIELCGEMGNLQTYQQLQKLAKSPIMSSSQIHEFTGEALALAIKNGGDPNAIATISSRSPLMSHHNIDDLELLLKHGANPNILDKHGRNALFYHNDPAIISLLLKHKAQPDILDHDGHSALDYWSDNQERRELLIKAGGQVSKAIKLVGICRWEGRAVILNDLDDYAYLILNQRISEQSDEGVISYYLASRRPNTQIKQTQCWDTFKAWIEELPKNIIIRRYDRCLEHFQLPEGWEQSHSLTQLFEQRDIVEAKERSFCACGEEQESKEKPKSIDK